MPLPPPACWSFLIKCSHPLLYNVLETCRVFCLEHQRPSNTETYSSARWAPPTAFGGTVMITLLQIPHIEIIISHSSKMPLATMTHRVISIFESCRHSGYLRKPVVTVALPFLAIFVNSFDTVAGYIPVKILARVGVHTVAVWKLVMTVPRAAASSLESRLHFHKRINRRITVSESSARIKRIFVLCLSFSGLL